MSNHHLSSVYKGRFFLWPTTLNLFFQDSCRTLFSFLQALFFSHFHPSFLSFPSLFYHQSSPKLDKSLSKKTRLRSVLFNAKLALLLAFFFQKKRARCKCETKRWVPFTRKTPFSWESLFWWEPFAHLAISKNNSLLHTFVSFWVPFALNITNLIKF